MGSTTEVILGFGGGIGQPVILLCKDDAPGKSPAIEQGNGFGRIVLRVDDATALSARLTAAGYTPDEMHADRSEEHTSELQSLMRISYAVFCLNKQKQNEK